MSDTHEVTTEQPIKKRAKPGRKPKAAKAARPPKPVTGEFAGVTATQCCTDCTAEKCVISTVAVCKHPYKTADSGCGPLTMKNRLKVRKLLKHQMIDLTGG